MPMTSGKTSPEFKTADGGPTQRAQRTELTTRGCASLGTSGTPIVDATSAHSRNRRSRPGRSTQAPIVGTICREAAKRLTRLLPELSLCVETGRKQRWNT